MEESRGALASGSVVGSLDAAATCAERVSAILGACMPFEELDFLRYCGAIMTSSAAIGEPCRAGGDIAPFCARGWGLCEDVCVALPREGEACLDIFCGPGLVCRGDGTCGAPRADGETCAGPDECLAPLRCIGGTCGALRAEAAACEITKECAVGLVCAAGACADGPASCTDDPECGHLSRCDGTWVSVCEPEPGIGAPCASFDSCGPDARCDFATSLCAPLPAIGEACSFEGPRQCMEGAYCYDGTICSAAGGMGAGCLGDDAACEVGLACFLDPGTRSGTCLPPGSLGASCGSPRQCEDWLFCNYADPSGATCQTTRGLGETCFGFEGECGTEATCSSSGVIGPPRPGPDGPGGPTPEGMCILLPNVGEDCGMTGRCAVDLWCASRMASGSCIAAVCDFGGDGGGGSDPGGGSVPPTPVPPPEPAPAS
jgi:hypothetical protein